MQALTSLTSRALDEMCQDLGLTKYERTKHVMAERLIADAKARTVGAEPPASNDDKLRRESLPAPPQTWMSASFPSDGSRDEAGLPTDPVATPPPSGSKRWWCQASQRWQQIPSEKISNAPVIHSSGFHDAATLPQGLHTCVQEDYSASLQRSSR